MTRGLKGLAELLSLYFHGFTPVEFVRGEDRITQHASGWRVNGSGHLERAKDAMALVEQAPAEEWRQVYCGINLFLVSDRGEVKKHDGTPADTVYLNGRCQVKYQVVKYGRLRDREIYRSHLVAMAFLNYQRGDEREIHHINGYRNDDSVANLVVLSREDHAKVHAYGPTAPTGPIEPDMPLPRQRAKKAEKQRQGKHAGAPVGLSYAAPTPPSVAAPSVEDEGEALAAGRSGGKRRRGKSTAKRRSDQRRAEEQKAQECPAPDAVDAGVASSAQAVMEAPADYAAAKPAVPEATEDAVETRATAEEGLDAGAEAAPEAAPEPARGQSDAPLEGGDTAVDASAVSPEAESAADEPSALAGEASAPAGEAGAPADETGVPADDARSGADEEGEEKPRRRRGRRGGRRHRRKAEDGALAGGEPPADAVDHGTERDEEKDAAPDAPAPRADGAPERAEEPNGSAELAIEADQLTVVEIEASVASAGEDVTVALTPVEEPRVFEVDGSAEDVEDFPLPTDVVAVDELFEPVVVDEVPSEEPLALAVEGGADEADREDAACEVPEEKAPAADAAPALAEDSDQEGEPAPASTEEPSRKGEPAPAAGAEASSDDWEGRRAAFDRELEQFLAGFTTARPEDGGEAAERARGRQVRHVYRALRPFHGCDDAVLVFDTALSALRRINQFATDRDEQVPGVVVGVLSQANQMLKGACARLAESDEVARACTIELLEEEAEAVVYRRLGYDAKLRKHVKLLEGSDAKDAGDARAAENPAASADASPKAASGSTDVPSEAASEPAGAQPEADSGLADAPSEADSDSAAASSDVASASTDAPALTAAPAAKRPARRSRRRRPGKRERARRPLPGSPNDLR